MCDPRGTIEAMTVRQFMVWSHRWLGLGSGIVLAIAGLTGALVLVHWSDPVNEWLIEVHLNLLGGTAGAWVVLAASFVGVLLQLGGLYLWWRTKSVALRLDRGWWRAAYDLHNVVGIVGLLLMGLLAATAVGRMCFRLVPLPPALEILPRANARLHSATGFYWPIQVVWGLGSLAFVVQAVTGALVWWRPSAPPRS